MGTLRQASDQLQSGKNWGNSSLKEGLKRNRSMGSFGGGANKRSETQGKAILAVRKEA